MDGSEKRPHLVSGNTPNKPREKRAREAPEVVVCVPSEERSARRTLAFHGKSSPLQKVLLLLFLIEYFTVLLSCAYLCLLCFIHLRFHTFKVSFGSVMDKRTRGESSGANCPGGELSGYHCKFQYINLDLTVYLCLRPVEEFYRKQS